ncbi:MULTISPECIES: MFS transporter [Bacillus]|uniref:MFS transporter n=1 Tax=Bacillus TaxID=1386 RepID=UPI0002E430F5|nr:MULTISPECIES: MFS transporter [Bacillus]
MDEEQKKKRATYHLWTFLVSKMISSLGSNVYSFGISLYILSITGSALSFAANLVCSIIPRTIFAPIVGSLSDRSSKKAIVLAGQAGSIIAVGGLLLYAFLFDLTLTAVYVTTALYSISSTFTGVGFSSSVANLVDEERIQRATSFNQLSLSVAAIGGPVVGGMLYGFVSIKVFLMIHMFAYFLSFILESTMNFRLYTKHQDSEDKEGIWKSTIQGIWYMKGKRIVSMILWMSLWLNFFFTAVNVGSSFILVELLKVEAKHVGIIEGAGAIGMLIASIYMSVRSTVSNPIQFSKRAILLMSTFTGVCALPLLVDFSYMGIVLFYILMMLGFSSCGVLTNTPIIVLLQKEVDEMYRGRIFGLLETMAMAMMPLGTILFGILYDFIPAEWLLITSSIFLISITLYMMRENQDLLKERGLSQ